MNHDNSKQYNDGQVDLRTIFKMLIARSRFIFGFTGVVTLIVIGYVLSITTPPPVYKAEVLFEKPDENSVIRLNHQYNLSETSDSIFTVFLTNLNSKFLQKEVFIDGNYAEKNAGEDKSIVNIDKDFDRFINKTLINTSTEDQLFILGDLFNTFDKDLKLDIRFKLPKTLSIEGSNPLILSEFLNETLARADEKTVNYFVNIQKLKIANRLNEIAKERQFLLAKSKQDRLSQIKRIKEKDNQLIRALNDSIDRARLKAKTDRINQVVILTNAAKLASSLGITNNNLKHISEISSSVNLNIAINDNDTVPDWYLYGEAALIEMIQLLEQRTNDDPYIPELAILKNQISEIKNNNLLKTLEKRLDDSPFINKINQLDVETIELESISLNSIGINAMRLYQPASTKMIPHKMVNIQLLIIIGLIGSFIFSLILVILMNIFKEVNYSIHKGK